MGLKETLKSDLTEAIRSSDKLVSGTIRMVLTAITNEEVSGKEARVLNDAEIITVLSREAKKRREAAEEFAKAGREDKAQEEKSEGEVIARYLPA
ncbi:MAG: GatB/YqeY domain-containing protein, partial [Candidatus Planktophila sp.]